MPLLAASTFFPDTVAEELIEHLFCQCPVLAVDAILHFRCLNLALYQSGILQLFKMLRHGGLGNRQFLVDIPKVTTVLLGQKVEYRYPCRMSQSLCKSGYLLLIDGIILLILFHIYCLLFAKLQTIFQLAIKTLLLLAKINNKREAVHLHHKVKKGNAPSSNKTNKPSFIIWG